MDRQEATAALAAAQAAQANLAEGMAVPAWRHLAIGLLVALVVAGVGLGRPWQWWASGAGLVGALALYRWNRARTGVVANALGQTGKRGVAILLVVVLLGASQSNAAMLANGAPLSSRLVLAALAGIVATAGSRLATRRYLATLRRGRAG